MDERLRELNAGSVTRQVISHAPTPGSASTEICREANNELKTAVGGSKGRCAGFAVIPMNDPAAATKELDHYVKNFKIRKGIDPQSRQRSLL